MAPAILSVIAFLALVVWRFVRAIAAQQQRHSNLLVQCLRISELGDAVVIADGPLENTADYLDRLDRKDRTKRYLSA